MFTITLPIYDVSYEFNKDNFESIFPESVITQILETTHKSSIDITQPFITPYILNIIQSIIKSRAIPSLDPGSLDYVRKAGDYLNMDLLLIISDPKYDKMSSYLKRLRLNLIDVKNSVNVKDFLGVAVVGRLLNYSIEENYESLLDYLLNQGVDPSINDNDAIREASWKGNPHIVRRLLQDSRINPGAKHNDALSKAVNWEHIDIVKLLLQDSRLDVTYFLWNFKRFYWKRKYSNLRSITPRPKNRDTF